MALPPRPSLRSSSRQSTFLPDNTATVGGSNPHPPTIHLGKRAHAPYLGNGDHQFSKKLRIDVPALTYPHVLPKASVTKPMSPGEKSPGGVTLSTTSALFTSRTNAAVPHPTNGIITTNGLTLVKEQVSIKTTVKHHKGANGKAIKVVDKRTLRSQDGGSRSKSELSLYFHNYEELISNEPKNSGILMRNAQTDHSLTILDFLTADTPILVVDEAPGLVQSNDGAQPMICLDDPSSIEAHLPANSLHPSENTSSGPSTAGITQKIDFSSIPQPTRDTATDFLSDDVFYKAHRRAERQEKQLRNIEKERAQHEKVQLERLLEGLKGHDWLRVMGISGITDSEKKSFEPKRDWFIREVSCLIDKFRRWKEEEKRRKVEKDLSVKADEEEEDDDDDDDDNEAGGSHADSSSGLQDVDALAALQLHNESVSASRTKHRGKHAIIAALQPPPLERPFTSFYSKPYMREAALGKHRRGRTRFAFGQVVPELAERPFGLPREMLTDDAIRASARSRRRARRESKDT
ncbi:hypothetical protein MMC11_005726 [Xylographa trunciseda]|nr:hypothetical protein [Xylographa trunciseda]